MILFKIALIVVIFVTGFLWLVTLPIFIGKLVIGLGAKHTAATVVDTGIRTEITDGVSETVNYVKYRFQNDAGHAMENETSSADKFSKSWFSSLGKGQAMPVRYKGSGKGDYSWPVMMRRQELFSLCRWIGGAALICLAAAWTLGSL